MRTALAAIFVLLCFLEARAQEDLSLWTTISAEKRVSKRFSVSLDQNLRLNENISQLDKTFTNLSLSFKLGKNVRLSGGYRFIQKYNTKERDVSYRHRVYGDIAFRFKYDFLVLLYRLRVQSQAQDIYSSELGSVPESTTRNKLELKFDLNKRYQPYLNTELFYQIQNPMHSDRNNYLNLARYCAGVDYELNKKNVIGTYYLIEQGLNFSVARNYVIGLSYEFVF